MKDNLKYALVIRVFLDLKSFTPNDKEILFQYLIKKRHSKYFKNLVIALNVAKDTNERTIAFKSFFRCVNPEVTFDNTFFYFNEVATPFCDIHPYHTRYNNPDKFKTFDTLCVPREHDQEIETDTLFVPIDYDQDIDPIVMENHRNFIKKYQMEKNNKLRSEMLKHDY